MNCKYSYQGELSNDRHYLYCNINNQMCTYIRYCGDVGDIISSDGYINCPILKKKESAIGMTNETPNKVLFEKRGKLWVETNDEIGQVVMVKNPYDIVPQYVKLEKDYNGEYAIYIPKKEMTKSEKTRNKTR